MIGVRVLSYRSSEFEYESDRLAKLSGYLLQVLSEEEEERIVTQIPSSAWRSGTYATLLLTCHVVWHPLSFAPNLPPLAPHTHQTLPQPGPIAPVAPPLLLCPMLLNPNRPPHPLVVHTLMSSIVAPASITRLLLRMLLPAVAKAKARSLPSPPLLLKSRPSSRPLHPRVLPLSPVLRADFTHPGTHLPPTLHVISSISVGLIWPPPY